MSASPAPSTGFAPLIDFSGEWTPVDLVTPHQLAEPIVTATPAQMRSWPHLALAILKINPRTLHTVENTETMTIKHTTTTLTVQHQAASTTFSSVSPSHAAGALTLLLDNKAHPFNTGSSGLFITATQLGEEDGSDLLIRIAFPPLNKSGEPIKKFANFAAEQLAHHRMGYVLERTHRSSEHKMTQVVQYHQAPSKMKDSAVAQLDAASLPIVYSISREYTRTPTKEERATFVRTISTGRTPTPVPASPASSTFSSSSASISSFPTPVSTPAPILTLPATTPYCTLTGVWKVDRTRGDTLEGMMKELGVPWIARKVVLALDVTTHIKHDPSQHTCTVTDVSSAGEQATKHSTMGAWNEVTTKEGKVVRMFAKEGSEMMQVWPDLPVPNVPHPFAPSEVPFTVPSYLPTPYSPALKEHSLPYGYLWIHSHLPDIAGGEMQDVRVLLDRTVMLQQTMILKDQKLTQTTTRYFTKQETEEERRQGEAEWKLKLKAWRRLQPDGANEVDEPAELPRSVSGSSAASSCSSGFPVTPMFATPVARADGPNLSGTWTVIKDRSNDLSVLLKRMGVPWIYRAFANTLDVRTTITHDENELSLKDQSRFGSHTQVLKLNGQWNRVVQYGNQRQGVCRVTSDPRQQSVTIETLYLAPGRGAPPLSSYNNIVRDPRPSSVASTIVESKEEDEPTPPMLTQESVISPARSDNLAEESLPPHDEPTSSSTLLSQDIDESKYVLGPQTPIRSSPVSRAHSPGSDQSPMEEVNLLLSDDLASPPTSPATVPAPASSTNVSVLVGSVPSTPQTTSASPSSNFTSPASSPPAPLIRSSSFSNAMRASGQVVTSRVLDIRVMLSSELMRQVITYLERDTVVCVCSRYHRRELTKEERAIKAAEESNAKDEERRRKDANKEAEEQLKRRKRDGDSSSSSSSSSTPSSSTGSSSSSSYPIGRSASAVHAAPVSVVLPSVAVESSIVTSVLPPALSLSALTPTRAFIVFIVLAAISSASYTLVAIVAAGLTTYVYQEELRAWAGMPPSPVTKQTSVAPRSLHRAVSKLPLEAGLEVEVVPLRRS